MVSDQRSERELNYMVSLAQAYADVAEGRVTLRPTNKFVKPLSIAGDLFVTTKYGSIDSSHPFPHAGIDLRAALKTPLLSPVDGIVSRRFEKMFGYGTVMAVDYITLDGERHSIIMAHLTPNSPLVPGTHVSAGQLIGLTGDTGVGTGPHLHLEIRDCTGRPACDPLVRPTKGGPPRVDPTDWLPLPQ